MARIEKILESNEKRVVINKYLDPSILTEGQDEFITIKKLPYSIRRKIEIISFNNLGDKARSAIFTALKKKGIKTDKMTDLSDADKAEVMSSINLSETDMGHLINSGMETAKLIIENSVDKLKHSFVDMKDKPVELTWDFFERLGSPELIDFIVEEAKSFSQGYSLGNSTLTE